MRNSVRLVALAFALAATCAAAQVYKWVDENGKVQYGDKPPEGAKAAPVGVAPAPSGGGAAPAAQPDWKQKDLDFQRRKIDRERKEANEGSRGSRDANREATCSDTRRRLGILQEQIPVYQRNDKGERVYIEDKDRPRMMDEYKRFLSENCR